MSLEFTGHQEHNGFMLSERFSYDGSLIVLTGKNGCGKTRFLESIRGSKSQVDLFGVRLTNQDIMFVAQANLNPSFGGAYNDTQFQTKITSSLQLFDRVKNELDSPFDQERARNRGRLPEGSIPYESLYNLCKSIAQHLGKSPSELTHEEIRIHFEDHVNSVLGFQNVSTICNQYIQRKKLNRYNRYRSEQEGEDVPFLSDEEFLNRFGGEPWKLINKIIGDTFDEKFFFTEPDEQSLSYTYNATLIQKDNDNPVSVDALSSGEKTLLWLGLTLFNSQYYDRLAVKTPKILLLDEPDAFLHPQMVVKMYLALNSFIENFNSRIVITTHSPTTVALAPENSTYIVTECSVKPVSKDEGVAELLDGVTQISINPENRRQVFVESRYDADVYQAICAKLLHRFDALDPKISLNFVSSGPKMPAQQLKDKAKQVFGIKDEEALSQFVESVNGVGNCVQVVGQVEALDQNDNETVRGIIDWDLKNEPTVNVSVLANGHAYSIENITLDPISIFLLIHTDKPEKYTMHDICGADVHWSEWLQNDELLQESVDRFIMHVIDRENKRDAILNYVSGKSLLTDKEYLTMSGHPLESLLKDKYEVLKGFARSGRDGELKYTVVSKSMINMTNGDFIPLEIAHVLSSVQK